MRILYTDQLTDPKSLPSKDKLYLYNGLDCLICREVYDVLSDFLDERTSLIYAFSRALQGPVMEMQLRGCYVDLYQRNCMMRLLEEQKALLERRLNILAEATWGDPLNAGSSQQKMAYLYDFAKCREVRKFDHKTQESRRTADRAAIEKTHAKYPKVRPITSCILKIMDVRKQLQTLKSGVDPDGFFRAAFNIAGTETGRFSSKKNAFGTGCFPPGAEALTKDGWQTLESIQAGTSVIQYSDGVLEWAPAVPVKETFSGLLNISDSEQFSVAVTPTHRLLTQNRKTKQYKTRFAIEASQSSDYYIPLSGTFLGSSLQLPRIVAALLADGHNDYGNHWRIAFKKSRKIERFIQLAKEANIPLTTQKAQLGYSRFALTVPAHFPKDFGAWILCLSQQSAKEFLKELAFWDGHKRNKSFMFFSAQKYRAEWVQTLAHLCNCSATLRLMFQSEASWSDTPMWFVNVKPRSYAHILRKHWRQEKYSGPVYCLSVPSSYFLVRWAGKISVTGNSNFQNWAEPLRIIFTSPDGPMPDREKYNIPEEFR